MRIESDRQNAEQVRPRAGDCLNGAPRDLVPTAQNHRRTAVLQYPGHAHGQRHLRRLERAFDTDHTPSVPQCRLPHHGHIGQRRALRQGSLGCTGPASIATPPRPPHIPSAPPPQQLSVYGRTYGCQRMLGPTSPASARPCQTKGTVVLWFIAISIHICH